MAMWTESEIKDHLDGSFWFWDQSGIVRHKFVEFDHIPNHKPGAIYIDRETDKELGSGGGFRINWPPNAYDLIDQMRNDRMTWQMIGQVFGASANATIEYYKKRHRKRQLDDDKKHYEVRSKEVGKMLRAGWSQAEIEQETGYSSEFIKTVASRLRGAGV